MWIRNDFVHSENYDCIFYVTYQDAKLKLKKYLPTWIRTTDLEIVRPALYHWATSSLLHKEKKTLLHVAFATPYSKCEDVIFLYILKIMIVFFMSQDAKLKLKKYLPTWIRTTDLDIERPVLYHWATSPLINVWHETL